MLREAFLAELVELREPFTKVAKASPVIGRLAAGSALAGLIYHLGRKGYASVTGDPYSAPTGTALGTAARMGAAGGTGGVLLEALAKMGRR